MGGGACNAASDPPPPPPAVAEAVSAVHGLAFFTCSASALLNRFWGETEKIARALFDVAREHAPSVIFFDEVCAHTCESSWRGSSPWRVTTLKT